jgi:hypothetical protein
MKRLLLLALLFTHQFTKGQTTIYHAFPDSNAIWNFNFGMYCFFNGTADDYYSITISGDTLINSQTYHKLTTPYIQSFSTGNCAGVVTTGYKGAIRQDTTNRKVFFIPPSNNAEELLYDFTIQVGDTVRGYTETQAMPPDIVQSIDSVLVGNTYRKRWKINTGYGINLIEGIGSTFGLIERSPGSVVDVGGYIITCFQQNGSIFYPDTITSCQLINSVYPIDIISTQVAIFPNPSKGDFTIDFNRANIKEIQLIDLLGNIIIRKQTENQTKINLFNLYSGTFILAIIDNDGNTTYKKIISCP